MLSIILIVWIFQSALPRGERPFLLKDAEKGRQISIRAPARGATGFSNGYFVFNQFQSALPRGERRSSEPYRRQCGYFNPRSREGSDGTELYAGGDYLYFNPRSREGSDDDTLPAGDTRIISIRAPARGATL